MRASLLLVAASGVGLALAGCAASGVAVRAPDGPSAAAVQAERARTTELVQAEEDAIGWMAAADPRLAARTGAAGPEEVLKRIGMDAVLAEDTAAVFHGTSLDLFAFRARAKALESAGKALAASQGPLPEVGPLGSALGRPKLERELLERMLGEERARAEEEAKLGDASGELVRGLVSTWAPPERPQDVQDRDVAMARYLTAIRESLRAAGPRTGPPDLDVALYPLERLLAPTEYPRASAAMAQVRMAIDADMRAMPKLRDAKQVAAGAKVHLGVDLEMAGLPARLERVEARLHDRAVKAMREQGADAQRGIEAKAREMLLVERPCPAVGETRVRAMAPPPERAVICGALQALTEEGAATAALVALHDDVLLARAAVEAAPPARTGLLSHPEDDVVDALQRRARERPVAVLGVALAAELLFADDRAAERLAAWRALGEAPLDVVARELALSAGGPPPAAPRPACPPPCTSGP
jgi:hypothetical protein